tara:strand:- start:293 stop:856 length:564 start_codon:yes stop_codon:yes gene_type:complete
MRKILAVMTAVMLVPTTTLASSIRPGSRVTHGSLNSKVKSREPLCKDAEEKFTQKCEITIDETGVKGPVGHITTVVQWKTEEQDFSVGGAAVGAVVGTGGGMLVGLGSCAFTGPFCLLTAPAIMSTGTMVGGGAGGNRSGRFFTILGDDAQGNRLIQEFKYRYGKDVKKTSKLLLKTTKLAEGEVRN